MTAATISRIGLGTLGVGVFAYGVHGLLGAPSTDPLSVVRWFIGGVIGHDVLLAPLVYILCAIAYRFTSARWRGRLAALLLIGGSLFLISIPALVRQGNTDGNVTVLPLDYARNLSVLLGVLVAAMVLYSAVDAAWRRRVATRRAIAAAADGEPGEDEPDGVEPSEDEQQQEPHEQDPDRDALDQNEPDRDELDQHDPEQQEPDQDEPDEQDPDHEEVDEP